MRQNERLRPGHPGRGFDPTSGFSDFQWYLFHQRCIAYFGAFSTEAYDRAAMIALARDLIAAAPHYNDGYRHAGSVPSDDLLARLCTLEAVDGFNGFPDCWLDDGAQVLTDPDLPLFRIRVAQRDTPDAQGRRSFVLVQVAHALTEGTDSARLTRSRSAARTDEQTTHPPASLRTVLLARLGAYAFAVLQLSLSRLFTPHSGGIVRVSRAFPRHQLQRIARHLGVSQRELFLALVAHSLVKAGTPEGKAKFSCAYTTLAPGGGPGRDSFMRMRMLYTDFRNRPGFTDFVRAVGQTLLAGEAAGSDFEDERKSTALRLHRRLSRLAPFLYSPRFFAFWPYDVVFSLLTPHEFTGSLSKGLLEPVYCGTSMPGVVGCIVVPGRAWVTFNFFVEEHTLPRIARLDALIGELSDRLDATPDAAVTPP